MIARSDCFLEIYFVTVITRKCFRLRNGYFNYTHFGVALVYVVVVVHRKLLHSADHQGPEVGGRGEGSCLYNVTLRVSHLSEALGSILRHM